MDESENPYEILGVNATASTTEIKAAYRKLALLHHPDRQSTDEDKQRAHVVFAKISNAYEILSDDKTRKKFDREQQRQNQPQQQQQYGFANNQNFDQPDFNNYYETPLHGSGRHGGGGNDFFDHHFRSRHPFAFHDPFEIFSQVFGEEFGTRRSYGGNNGGLPRGGSFHDNGGFMDPFQAHRSNMMFNDPFFGSSGFGGGGMFGGNDLFSSMNLQMDMMAQQMQQQQQQQGSRSAGGPQVFYSSSSSSFGGGGGGGHVTSVSTSTRIINGKRQTVTERITTKPDGTIERHVETSGDDNDFLPLPQQRQQQQQALPAPQRRSSRSQQQPPLPPPARQQLEEHKPQRPRPQAADDDDPDRDHDQSNKRSRFSWRRKS